MYRESSRGIVLFQCDIYLLSEVDRFCMGDGVLLVNAVQCRGRGSNCSNCDHGGICDNCDIGGNCSHGTICGHG